jgi:hypothetical protein
MACAARPQSPSFADAKALMQTDQIIVSKPLANGARHTVFEQPQFERLLGDTARAATTDEVKQLRREAQDLKEVVDAESMYYSWSKEFLEAGKRRLAGWCGCSKRRGCLTLLIFSILDFAVSLEIGGFRKRFIDSEVDDRSTITVRPRNR